MMKQLRLESNQARGSQTHLRPKVEALLSAPKRSGTKKCIKRNLHQWASLVRDRTVGHQHASAPTHWLSPVVATKPWSSRAFSSPSSIGPEPFALPGTSGTVHFQYSARNSTLPLTPALSPTKDRRGTDARRSVRRYCRSPPVCTAQCRTLPHLSQNGKLYTLAPPDDCQEHLYLLHGSILNMYIFCMQVSSPSLPGCAGRQDHFHEVEES